MKFGGGSGSRRGSRVFSGRHSFTETDENEGKSLSKVKENYIGQKGCRVRNVVIWPR